VPIERRDTVLDWPKTRQAADRIDWLASAVRVFDGMGAIWLRRRLETRDACRACWWLVNPPAKTQEPTTTLSSHWLL